MAIKLDKKFSATPIFDWDNQVVSVTVAFASPEDAGRAVDFVKAMAKTMWPDTAFRGDDDWVEPEEELPL